MKHTAHLLPTWPYLARPSAYSAHWMAWLAACGHYYAASASYEELSRLSDAEFKRRRLNRTTASIASRAPDKTT